MLAENAHEAIITQEIYDEVQKLHRRNPCKGTSESKRLFAYKLYCSCCGYALKYNPALNPYYHCNADRSGYSTIKCFDERVYESDIIQTLISAIKIQLDYSLSLKTKLGRKVKNTKQSLDDVLAQTKKLSERMNLLELQKTELFKTYADGKLPKDRYIEAKENCMREMEKIKWQITEFENKAKANVVNLRQNAR